MKEAKLRKLDNTNDGVLPTDVLYEVLLRLPVDELCRLRLVCRRWRTLTSDPLFAKAHRSRHSHLVAFPTGSGEVHVLDLSGNIVKRIGLEFDQRHGCCISFNAQHDLVCVTVSGRRCCVLSLTTGAVISDFSFKHYGNKRRLQPLRFVLGHVATTGVYKVLRLYNVNDQVIAGQECHVVKLGCSDGSRWRATANAPVRVVVRPSISTVVIGGVAYFLVINGENPKPDSIASFDFALEEWRPRMIQGPLSSLDPVTKERLGYNHLNLIHFMLTGTSDCLVFLHSNYNNCSTDLWFMDDMEDMSSLWTRRYSVGRDPYLGCPGFSYFCPLVVSDDGVIIFYVEKTMLLKAYDLKTHMWADVDTGSYCYAALAMHQGSLLYPRLLG